MKYLFKELQQVVSQVKDKKVAVFLDYDGTLVRIEKTPEKARLPEATRDILAGLASSRDIKAAVISGRSLKQIKELVRVKGLIYAGNHGLEISGGRIKREQHVSPGEQAALDRAFRQLRSGLSGIRGVLLEDKGATISVHYRLADRQGALDAKRIFKRIVRPLAAKKLVRTTSGKKVLEVRPAADWDKGKAVVWLLKKMCYYGKKNVLPIYIGDDKTDEDAFRALKGRGLTVCVGKKHSGSARYYLKGPRETGLFLSLIIKIKSW